MKQHLSLEMTLQVQGQRLMLLDEISSYYTDLFELLVFWIFNVAFFSDFQASIVLPCLIIMVHLRVGHQTMANIIWTYNNQFTDTYIHH